MDLVSVIIPNYNRKLIINKAIKSVLEQSYNNIELIIIDDGSIDNSYEYLKDKYQQEKRIILLKITHSGVSAARNKAIKIAKGKWIAFLDSDDFFHLDKISKQIKYLQENPNYKICHSEEIWFKNQVRINPKKKHLKIGGDIFKRSVELCSISISTVIIHQDIIEDIGLFDENLPACEDYDYWLRVTAKYKTLFLPEYLTTKFGGHADQLSQKYYAMDRFRIYALAKIIEAGNLTKEQYEFARNILQKKLMIFLQGAKKHNNLEEYNEYSSKYAKYLAS
ncbi:MAG: glycosyltransferase [Rickettsiales bacterium]|nr:glycosyltransferase [Rickettsiales bacterium]